MAVISLFYFVMRELRRVFKLRLSESFSDWLKLILKTDISDNLLSSQRNISTLRSSIYGTEISNKNSVIWIENICHGLFSMIMVTGKGNVYYFVYW